MLESSQERGTFARHRWQQYVGRDAVAALHQLLRVAQTQSLDLQAFFDLLQRCGEERGLMELSNEVGGRAGAAGASALSLLQRCHEQQGIAELGSKG